MVSARTRPRVKGNRLVKAQRVVPSVNTTTVATYAYDGLPALDTPRRAKPVIAKRSARLPSGGASRVPSIEKTVTYNGIEETSSDGGNRHEHYFWGGMGVSPVNWRLIETQTHGGSPKALYQVVYGTQYIDEPVRYDGDTDDEATAWRPGATTTTVSGPAWRTKTTPFDDYDVDWAWTNIFAHEIGWLGIVGKYDATGVKPGDIRGGSANDKPTHINPGFKEACRKIKQSLQAMQESP
jgi:hypothetical protein